MSTILTNQRKPIWLNRHAAMRGDGYVLLGALLTQVPTDERLELVGNLHWSEDIFPGVQQCLAALTKSGLTLSGEEIREEYNRLFVGLGSGKLVPYGSWYIEKTMQSTPLANIRSDLVRLEIARQAACFDSEDHAGALCEIMALLCTDEKTVSMEEQAAFFEHHLAPWMTTFFEDMQKISNNLFYQALGQFGQRFLEAETEFLANAAKRNLENKTLAAKPGQHLQPRTG